MPGFLDELSSIGSGAESILSHPLVQGALASYLGMISTPRRYGLGIAFGQGGLAGLGQFAQAEKAAAQQPLIQAKLQETQAQTKLAGERGELAKAQVARLGPDINGAQQLQLMSKDPSATPMQRHIWQALSGSVGNGHVTFADALKAGQNEDLASARVLAAKASAAASQARGAVAQQEMALRPGLVKAEETADVARAGEAGAATALSRARLGEVAPTIEHMKAETEHLEHPAPKVTDPTAEAAKGLGNIAKARADYEASMLPGEKYITGNAGLFKSIISRGLNPKTGKALEVPPAGYSYTGDATKDGDPVVRGPDGKLHAALSD